MKNIICAFAWAATLAAPQVLAVEFEPSIKYWISEGKTTWNHNAQPASPLLGNPTSQLTYSGMKSHIVEFGLTAQEGDYFGNLSLGVGNIDSGTLRDEDWLAGQVKFSDTNSSIRGDKLRYWVLDVGYNHFRTENSTVAGLVGYGEYEEVIDAFGATNNLAGGAPLISESTRVITNDAKWKFFRLGMNGKTKLNEQFTLLGELAYLPFVKLTNDDSHYLRSDLGPVPNIRSNGSGDGWMWQVESRYYVTKAASFSLAYRDWRFKADGTIRFGSSTTSLPLNKFETSRNGVRLGFSYLF